MARNLFLNGWSLVVTHFSYQLDSIQFIDITNWTEEWYAYTVRNASLMLNYEIIKIRHILNVWILHPCIYGILMSPVLSRVLTNPKSNILMSPNHFATRVRGSIMNYTVLLVAIVDDRDVNRFHNHRTEQWSLKFYITILEPFPLHGIG